MDTYLSYATLAGLCGCWGLLGSLAWSFARTRRGMLTVLMLCQPGYVVYWVLLGHRTAALMTVLGMGVNLLSLGLEGPADSARVRWTRRAYLAALVPVFALTLSTWEGLPSLLAGTGVALGCIARWQIKPMPFRLLMSTASLPWLAHDLLVGTLPALASDAFGIARGIQIALCANPRTLRLLAFRYARLRRSLHHATLGGLAGHHAVAS
jgi:hypothetical protein